jgi:hypothetical protein
LPPDGAQEKSILANNIQHRNKKGKCRKRINYSFTSQNNTPTHIHAKSVINIKIQRHINRAARTWNFAQHELQKEKPNDRKQLYEANHLYLMIAIITENIQENRHLKTSLIAKTTSHINMQKKFHFSPLDGAHYANFSSSLKLNNQGRQCEIQQ